MKKKIRNSFITACLSRGLAVTSTSKRGSRWMPGLFLATFSLTASVSAALVTSTAWAQYQPPEGDPPSGPIVSNGSRRGCSEAYEIPLTALAPTQHVGQSTSTTPMLAWFAPATDAYRIKLSVYAISSDDTVTEERTLELLQQFEYEDTTEGIAGITLPADQPELTIGQRYLWEVSLACTPNSPIYDQSFIAEIDIKTPPATLTTALATAQTPQEKVELYASAGYWYDALREALQASESLGQDEVTQALLSELAESETEIQSDFLTQIVEIIGPHSP